MLTYVRHFESVASLEPQDKIKYIKRAHFLYHFPMNFNKIKILTNFSNCIAIFHGFLGLVGTLDFAYFLASDQFNCIFHFVYTPISIRYINASLPLLFTIYLHLMFRFLNVKSMKSSNTDASFVPKKISYKQSI